jgi:hypothetical protein
MIQPSSAIEESRISYSRAIIVSAAAAYLVLKLPEHCRKELIARSTDT